MLNLRRKSQYELQFKKWQFRKNRTAGEWKIVAHKLMKRKLKHKETEVILNGKFINPKKLSKETRRYGSISTGIEHFPPGMHLYVSLDFVFSPRIKVYPHKPLRASLYAPRHQCVPDLYQSQHSPDISIQLEI